MHSREEFELNGGVRHLQVKYQVPDNYIYIMFDYSHTCSFCTTLTRSIIKSNMSQSVPGLTSF